MLSGEYQYHLDYGGSLPGIPKGLEFDFVNQISALINAIQAKNGNWQHPVAMSTTFDAPSYVQSI